jgi:hypothetical protein
MRFLRSEKTLGLIDSIKHSLDDAFGDRDGYLHHGEKLLDIVFDAVDQFLGLFDPVVDVHGTIIS